MTKRTLTDNASCERSAVSVTTLYDDLAHKPWLLALVLVASTFVAYQPVWHAGFIWDDDAWTTEISRLLRDVPGLLSIWCHPTALQQYYPLTATTFWLDYHLWGFWALPYHVENVLLHALAALLFWRLLWRLEVPGAWLAGAIFAVHPVMVESAAWVTERKNVLSLVLYLGALLAYGRWTSFWIAGDDSSPCAKRSPAHWDGYGLAWLLALGALLAKTTAFSLPAVILLICWWKRGRIQWLADVLPTVPFFAIAIGMGLLTAWLERTHVGAVGPEWAIPFPERCLIAGRALVFYTGRLLWPVNLCFVYPRWQLDAHSLRQWLYPTVAVGTVWWLWVARGRIGRGPAAAAFFFIGTLLPVLGFMNAYFMRYSFVCDHWVYLPSLGLIALAAVGITSAFKLLRQRRVIVESTVCATLLLTLAACTWRQAHIYRDVETLWPDTIAKNPRCWMAHNNLGATLASLGRVREAMEHYEQALRINPDDAETHNNLGSVLRQTGEFQQAILQYKQALRIRPRYAHAYYNLGNLLLKTGKVPEAISQYEHATQTEPNLAEAHEMLGSLLITVGKRREAMGHLEQALKLRPDLVEAENNLAWLLATLPPADGGDTVRAVNLAERACQSPNNLSAGNLDTLAVAYAAAGRFSEAIATAEKAIELAQSAGQTNLVAEIGDRLQLYRSGRAYRESADVTAPTHSVSR
jgi:tetratricopeptide (TPR) repeat protein